MKENFYSLKKNEKLQAENEYLKMKMTLENGAQFGTMETGKGFSAGEENQFLNYIMEIENQAANPKYIKLYDKIEKPTYFKPIKAIPENENEKAYGDLSGYINKYRFELTVCSPNISISELYRFTIEELFEEDVDEIEIQGTVTTVIYDLFHPDPIFDNQQTVEDDLIPDIFSKEPIFFDYGFSLSDIILNEEIFPDYESFKEKINSFKSFYSKISLEEINTSSVELNEKESVIKGFYKALFIAKEDLLEGVIIGQFIIEMVKDDIGYFLIKKMHFEGIKF